MVKNKLFAFVSFLNKYFFNRFAQGFVLQFFLTERFTYFTDYLESAAKCGKSEENRDKIGKG